MAVRLSPSPEQRNILEQLDVSENIAAALRQTSFLLNPKDARVVGDALTEELARSGFDSNYELSAEGHIIEGLIDELFVD